VKTNGAFHEFNLTMKPMGKPESLKNMIIVLFEEYFPPKKQRQRKKGAGTPDDVSQRSIDLEREIARLQQDHRIAMEELETSNEELKSVNEELQSSNEELQSTNEELESSREELQSLNEELSTVNAELHEKIVELSQSYDTINHLLNSTGIAMLFLDKELNVQRFTQAVTELINLIEADIGRSLSHISNNLTREAFLEDIRRAIVEQREIHQDLRTREGNWYSANIVPHRDQKGQVSGVVITFQNVDRLKDATRRLDEAGL
jgi:two-component system CheB/CheR fusion protein